MSEPERMLSRTREKLEAVRDALAVVSARSAVGDPQSLLQAASSLEEKVADSQDDCERVQQLINELGASSMLEAVVKLCSSGRPDAARAMMYLHELTAGMASAQADVGAFLEECLQSLEITQDGAMRQARGGRLLGSA